MTEEKKLKTLQADVIIVNMNGYTKEYVSDLLFNKIDAILIVDAKNDSYRTIKKEGLFENFLESEGSYKNLVEKLWLFLH